MHQCCPARRLKNATGAVGQALQHPFLAQYQGGVLGGVVQQFNCLRWRYLLPPPGGSSAAFNLTFGCTPAPAVLAALGVAAAASVVSAGRLLLAASGKLALALPGELPQDRQRSAGAPLLASPCPAA